MEVVIADVEHQAVELANLQLPRLIAARHGVHMVDKHDPFYHFAFGAQAKVARRESNPDRFPCPNRLGHKSRSSQHVRHPSAVLKRGPFRMALGAGSATEQRFSTLNNSTFFGIYED